MVVIDEAHVVKNDATTSHTTVRWLQLEFMVLATASITPNRLEDFRGYMEFIQADPDIWERIDDSRVGSFGHY
jgi:hypothetical protein